MLSVGIAWQNFQTFRIQCLVGLLPLRFGKGSARFARMILQRGRFGNESVLDRATFDSILSLPFESQSYGLGWSIREENGRPTEISHSGSLASSRASMQINLDNGRHGTVFYMLVEQDQSGQVTQQLNRAIIRTIRQ